jgi:asparagine synthase (glutamine-hydrolysing)
MLRDLLDQAVGCRLRSAFPIGTHLSGGLDSSAIAVVAARILRTQGKTLHGFSWSPPLTTPIDAPNDERRLVEEICQREQIQCHYLSLTGKDYLNFRARNFLTEPTEMLQCEQKVQAEVARHKIRVTLSGWGGDEAISFNGRGYFAELFLKGHWRTLYRELKLRGEIHGLGLKGQLIGKVIVPLLPDYLVTRLEALTNDLYQPPGKSAYIHPDLVRKVKSMGEKLPEFPYLARERVGVRNNQRMLIEYGHLTNRIEAWARSGGQHQLVYSYPLLDQRIVEFALGIPDEWFFKQGWKRYLIRSATEGLLPDSVRWNKLKRDPASFALLDDCQNEIVDDWRAMRLARFQANRQLPQLAEWIDLERLEQALTGQEPPQPGFVPAAMLATHFAETSPETQRDDSQVISAV